MATEAEFVVEKWSNTPVLKHVAIEGFEPTVELNITKIKSFDSMLIHQNSVMDKQLLFLCLLKLFEEKNIINSSK